jgi:RimJ/RimL family protein N-acetyltransferase
MTIPDIADLAPIAPLESERLLLREVEKGDLADMLEVHSSDLVTRFLPYGTWHCLADAEAWHERVLNRRAAGSALQFSIVRRSDERVIGTSLLFNFHPDSARAELGYVLGQAAWGQGYMQESLATLLQFAFTQLQLNRIEAEVDVRNAASNRCLRHLGFTHEGLLRQRWINKGEVKDTNIYSLLREEWRKSPLSLA